jgi:hypothetical protein
VDQVPASGDIVAFRFRNAIQFGDQVLGKFVLELKEAPSLRGKQTVAGVGPVRARYDFTIFDVELTQDIFA